MLCTVLLIPLGLAIIQTSVAQRGAYFTYFYDDDHKPADLAIFDGSVEMACEIKCGAGEMVELIGPSGDTVSSGLCSEGRVATMDELKINDSLAFGEYKCKYKDLTMEERDLSWVYQYRTCSKTERQGISEPNPKRLYVVDSNDSSCHMVRSCGGDRQHVGTYRKVCPANERTICHAAAVEKYGMALVEVTDVRHSCAEKREWYVSYAGLPIVLRSMVQLHGEIRNFKIHCATAKNYLVKCSMDEHEFNVTCTGAADLLIPDEVFDALTESEGRTMDCEAMGGTAEALLVYAAPGRKMTCTVLQDVSINCKFEPKLWSKFDVKKIIKCTSGDQELQVNIPHSQEDFVITRGLDLCAEYNIVAEVFYQHPETLDIFKLPRFESGPFHKRSTTNPPTEATANKISHTYPGPQSSTLPGDGTPCPNATGATCGYNAADSFDPGPWYIGVQVGLILVAILGSAEH